MQEKVTTLPSGLFVVEHVPEPVPEPASPPASGKACRVCGKPVPAAWGACQVIVGWTRDGWEKHDPICRHGAWYECPACRAAPAPPLGADDVMTPERAKHFAVRNCPVCGEDGEYT